MPIEDRCPECGALLLIVINDETKEISDSFCPDCDDNLPLPVKEIVS